ncbi:MAG: hypothetical protein KDM91_17680 [Verrucomicrobiae bacterium]|nr:hypothetical protein [Verrucomicrobiae bacterium]MCP5541417.1 hypothetical protein [Akkermansiaceae bacterium]
MDSVKRRSLIRAVAFWTIIGWIALVTVLVILMIWQVIDDPWVNRVILSASTLSGGVLLGCVTWLGFSSAAEEETPRSDRDGGETGHGLRESFQKAKEGS